MACKEIYPDIYTPPPDDPEEAKQVEKKNAIRKRLFLAVRYVLRENFAFDPNGSITTKPEEFPPVADEKARQSKVTELHDEKILFASVYGILLSRNFSDPSFGRLRVGLPEDRDIVIVEDGETVYIVPRFIEAVTDAVKLFNANRDVFHKAFHILLEEGGRKNEEGELVSQTLRTRQLAEVASRLVDDRVPARHPQFRRFVIAALSQSLGAGLDGDASRIDIRLPDLDVGTAIEIISANVDAIALIYFSAMLEEMKFYAVMDKVAEQFMVGMIPISRGPAGDRIYDWIRRAPDRFTELERRGIYGRVIGVAQGATNEGMPNREFPDLWIRCLSTINLLDRDKLSLDTRVINSTQAHKATRDLAVNLSLHGYGVAHFAAVEMQRLIREIQDLLSTPELLKAYGVNDRWQLVERVSGLYLNGAANGVRYRTMANSGGWIIQWIARNAPQLSAVAPPPDDFFLDAELVSHVNQWLAVTGTGLGMIDQRVDPVDFATQPTIPTMVSANGGNGNGVVPSIRGALEQAGIGGLPAVPQV